MNRRSIWRWLAKDWPGAQDRLHAYAAAVTYGHSTPLLALLEHSLQLCRQVKSPPFLAQVYTCLAETALWEKEWEQAAQYLAQAVANRGFPTHMIIGERFRLFAAVRLAAAQGHYKRAATLAGVADATQPQTNNVYAGPALVALDPKSA